MLYVVEMVEMCETQNVDFSFYGVPRGLYLMVQHGSWIIHMYISWSSIDSWRPNFIWVLNILLHDAICGIDRSRLICASVNYQL